MRRPLPLTGERLQVEKILCDKNPVRHIEKHFWIKNKDGAMCLMSPLKWGQRKLLSLRHYQRHIWKCPGRVITLKSRQVGVSTEEERHIYDEVRKHELNGLVIAHDSKTSERIFEMCKRFHRYYDMDKPREDLDNKRELKFKDHEGLIEVVTANQTEAVRSRTLQVIHGSEVAFWEKGVNAAVALMQTVPKRVHTWVNLESTANGEDPLFKPYWDNAYRHCKIEFYEDERSPFGFHIERNLVRTEKWNGYHPLFIGAYEDEDCWSPLIQGEAEIIESTLNPYEEMLLKQLNVKHEFIKWRREVLYEKCQGDEQIMKREYPCTPSESFMSSARPRFNISSLDAMPIVTPRVGSLVRSDRFNRDITFLPDPHGLWSVWGDPIPGHRYVIGLDTSEGLIKEGWRDPDSTVFIVLDQTAGGEQVCRLSGQISEENVVEPFLLTAEHYNGAFMVIERNAGGVHVVHSVKKVYPNERIYKKLDWDNKTKRNSHIMGFRTTHANRTPLVSQLASAIHTGGVIIHDEDTQNECRWFHYSVGGRPEASFGHHDDHVFALALALEGMVHLPNGFKPFSPYMAGAGNIQRSMRYRGLR